MLLYVIVALLSYVFLNRSKVAKTKKGKIILILSSFMLLFFVSAFRVNVGTDYLSYKEWFNSISEPSFGYVNFCFNNLIYIIKLFTNNSQYFFAATSFLILSIIYMVNIDEKKDYDMSLFLFIALGFYFSTFNGIRQWIAVALFMWAYKFAIKKDLKKYVILILVASLFHITALLLLPFYFVFNFKIKDKIKLIIVAIFLFVFKFLSFESIIAFLLENFAITFYYRYISSGVDLSQGVGSPFPILLSGGMLLYYIIFKSKFLKNMSNEMYEQNKHLCFIITIFAIINTVNNLFSRFALYFIPMLITLLPDSYAIFDKKWTRIMKVLIIVVGIAFMIINTTLKNSNNPLPYNSIFGMFGNI